MDDTPTLAECDQEEYNLLSEEEKEARADAEDARLLELEYLRNK